MTNTKPVIAVPIGDPAGVGPEIVAKSLALPKVNDAANVIVIGDKKVMERAIGIVGADLTINVVEKAADGDYRPGIMNLIDLDNIDQSVFLHESRGGRRRDNADQQGSSSRCRSSLYRPHRDLR